MNKNENVVSTKVNQKKLFDTKSIAKIGILSAVATLLMLLDFPLFFAPSFYKLDFSEVIVLLGAFSAGPVAGIAIEAVKILLNFALNGTDTAGVGEIANFLIGCSFLVPAAIIYMRKKSRKGAIIGMLAGTILMTAVGAIMNMYVLIPVYSVAYGLPVEVIVAMGTKINPAITSLEQMVLLAVVPFNLLKGIVTSVITFLLYKRVSELLHR